jgi:hypothetical protein
VAGGRAGTLTLRARVTALERRELEEAVRAYIRAKNEDPKPFVWTKTADQILENLPTSTS